MSAVLPNCTVCLSPWLKDADALIKQGTSLAAITRTLKSRRAAAVHRGTYKAEEFRELTYDMMKQHSRHCVEREPEYVFPSDGSMGDGRGRPTIEVSAEELRDPKKRLDVLREALSQKLGDLSAKDLYAMYMAELRLQEKEAERDAKRAEAETAKSTTPAPTREPERDDGLDEAMAAAVGHRPDLRVMRGRREVARR